MYVISPVASGKAFLAVSIPITDVASDRTSFTTYPFNHSPIYKSIHSSAHKINKNIQPLTAQTFSKYRRPTDNGKQQQQLTGDDPLTLLYNELTVA